METAERRFNQSHYFWRYFRWMLLVWLLLVTPSLYLFYTAQARQWQIEQQAEMRSAVDLLQVRIQTEVEDLRILQTLTEFFLRGKYEIDPVSLRSDLSAIFQGVAKNRGQYDQIRFIDTTGQEWLRVDCRSDRLCVTSSRSALEDKSSRDYFEKGIQLSNQQIYISPLELSQVHGKIQFPLRPTIHFVAPIDVGGKRLGVVVLNYHASDLLQKVKQISKEAPGQLYLIDRFGNFIIGPTAQSEWAHALLKVTPVSVAHFFGSPLADLFLHSTAVDYSTVGYLLRTAFVLSDAPYLKSDLGLLLLWQTRWHQFFWPNVLYWGLILIGSLFAMVMITYLLERIRVETESHILMLQKFAEQDDLTKIFNRKKFFEEANRYAYDSRRYQHGFSLLMLDLDHFKNINDTFGHAIGDEVLVTFVEHVKKLLRKTDLFARMGGEEFVILLPFTVGVPAQVVAERIVATIGAVRFSKPDLKVTVSIGVTEWQAEDKNVARTIARADAALYQAKNGGRNRVGYLFSEDGNRG